jgi:nucleoside-diphosphate-sugar epimerase
VRVLVTGGSGVLGRATLPVLRARGHEVVAPARTALDLEDAAAIARSVVGCDAVLHLATRIPPAERRRDAAAWSENDRLRTSVVRGLVDAALAASVRVFVQPTVAFVYAPGTHVTEESPLGEVAPYLAAALVAEAEAARFAAAGRRGVVLRLGLLDGPGTGNVAPDGRYGATLHADDAGEALAVALDAASGVYNVTRDGDAVSSERFQRTTGWRPRH